MTSLEQIKISEETIKKFNDLLKEKGIFNETLNLQGYLQKKTKEAFIDVCSSQSMKKGVEYMVKDTSPYTLIVNKSQTGEINGFIYIKPVNSCVKTGSFIGYPTCSIEYICTNIKGISKYLIGLVMYAIYNDNKNIKNVILQTDRGYTNTSAYCLYKKMGFNYDKSLIPSCFNNIMNVPMYCNPYDNDTLIKYLTTSDNYDEVCLEKDLDTQKKMAAYKKVETYLFEKSKDKINCDALKKLYKSDEEIVTVMYDKYIKTLISKYPEIVLESYKHEDVSKRCAIDLKLINKELENSPVPAPSYAQSQVVSTLTVPTPATVTKLFGRQDETPDEIQLPPPPPPPDELRPRLFSKNRLSSALVKSPKQTNTMSAGLKKRTTRNRKKTNKRISKKRVHFK